MGGLDMTTERARVDTVGAALATGGPAGAPVRAPLDEADLRAVLQPLGRARTLPSAAYTERAVLDWEAERFFARSWVCVGRAAELPDPGDQRAVRVGPETVLLVRDADGTLRGFFNTCRHRGHELLRAGEGASSRVVRCPYHAWVYRLDGTLRSAPRFAALAPDDPAREGLIPARVSTWNGWVFVNANGDARSLAGHVGDLDGLLRPYDPGRLVAAARHDYLVQANWKIVVENYHECYHCPSIHPELCTVSPPDSGENFTGAGCWVGGNMTLRPHARTMSLDGRAGAPPLPGVTGDALRQVLYVGLFPNLLISAHPDYVMTHRLEPVEPGVTRIECDWLFDPDAARGQGFDPAYATEFWDRTNRQDWSACESVQRGAASRGYRPGPLADHEDAVHEFLRLVALGYRDGTVPMRPGAGA
jgi:glycine betaine catabolism A